jgi:hypothetical protein
VSVLFLQARLKTHSSCLIVLTHCFCDACAARSSRGQTTRGSFLALVVVELIQPVSTIKQAEQGLFGLFGLLTGHIVDKDIQRRSTRQPCFRPVFGLSLQPQRS